MHSMTKTAVKHTSKANEKLFPEQKKQLQVESNSTLCDSWKFKPSLEYETNGMHWRKFGRE